ncbi:MAG: hypothetical protein AAGH89_18270, partial [Verrucomicrobiota bacterium]
KVEKFPVPKPGQTFFYVVTPNGIFKYPAKEDELSAENDTAFSILFRQGHVVIRHLRNADRI